jgi:hypothetical protein
MRACFHTTATFALLITACSAVAAPVDGAWVSYRDAYRAMVVFEKYGKPKHLIQQHFQVMPKEKSVSLDGLQLSLTGKNTSLNLPLDGTGRAVFPLLKAAYDDNAILVLNRASGQYQFRPRVSIVVRPDGVYESGDLRSACEQALAYQRSVDPQLRAGRCVGVRFVFPAGTADAGVRVRKGEGDALSTGDGPAFQGDASDSYRVVNYRFGGASEKGHVVTQSPPLAINPVYE